MKFLIALVFAVAVASAAVVRYDGYQVYRVHFETEEQFNRLYELDIHETTDAPIMFWQLSHAEHYADIMVAPQKVSSFLASLDSFGYTYELTIKNVQDTIDAETAADNKA